MADSFFLHYTSLSLSLWTFFSLSPPRLFHLHSQITSNQKKKYKPQMVRIQQMVQYSLMVTRLNKSGVRIIKEPVCLKAIGHGWKQCQHHRGRVDTNSTDGAILVNVLSLAWQRIEFCHWTHNIKCFLASVISFFYSLFQHILRSYPQNLLCHCECRKNCSNDYY